MSEYRQVRFWVADKGVEGATKDTCILRRVLLTELAALVSALVRNGATEIHIEPAPETTRSSQR